MACSSIRTRLAVAMAIAPPEPPSPRMTATFGTPRERQVSVERAIASAWPRSSADAGIGAGGVHQRNHRDAKAVCHFHQPDSLPITLRTCHSEIMFEAALCVRTLFMADDADAFTAETTEPTDNRCVVAELAVTGERNEILDQPGNVVETMWSLWMSSDLGFLPRRKFGIELFERSRCFRFQPTDLFADSDRIARLAHSAQFFDFGLELGHGLFEVEVTAHWVRAKGAFSKRNDAGKAL